MARAEDKAPDMTDDELMTLVNEYENRKTIIDCEVKTVDFGKKRNKAWEEITEAVNACSTYKRTPAQIKIKMKNLKTRAKSRFTSAKRMSGQTGGGPPPKQLSRVEEKLVAMYKNSAAWVGVPGGQESSEIPPYVESTPSNFSAASTCTSEGEQPPGPSTTPSAKTPTSPSTPTARAAKRDHEPSVKQIRLLQVRALQMQIKASESVIATCDNINNILIPNLAAKTGVSPGFLKDLCNVIPDNFE